METRTVLKGQLHFTVYETTYCRHPRQPASADGNRRARGREKMTRRHVEDIMFDYAYETNTAPKTGGSQYVTAFFDSRAHADAAIDRIVTECVAHDDIRVVEGNDAAVEPAVQEDKDPFEALGDFFMPDEDRATYADGLDRGGYLVSLTTTASNRDRILDDVGTVDMDEREARRGLDCRQLHGARHHGDRNDQQGAACDRHGRESDDALGSMTFPLHRTHVHRMCQRQSTARCLLMENIVSERSLRSRSAQPIG